MILLLTTIAVEAEITADARFVTEVEQSGVNFIYNTKTGVVILKTEETAKVVDDLVAKKPDGLEVNVVVYKNTGNVPPGFVLEDDTDGE